MIQPDETFQILGDFLSDAQFPEPPQLFPSPVSVGESEVSISRRFLPYYLGNLISLVASIDETFNIGMNSVPETEDVQDVEPSRSSKNTDSDDTSDDADSKKVGSSGNPPEDELKLIVDEIWGNIEDFIFSDDWLLLTPSQENEASEIDEPLPPSDEKARIHSRQMTIGTVSKSLVNCLSAQSRNRLMIAAIDSDGTSRFCGFAIIP